MYRGCSLILPFILAAALLNPAFAADLQAPDSVIPNSYFGLHIHHLAYPVPTPWPNMPVPEWRIWDADVTWADLEPAQGEWRFEKLDRYVAMAAQHNTGLLLTLGGTPKWASAKPESKSNYYPGFTGEPAKIEYWREYVRTVVLRYKGRVQSYEIWNEPNWQEYWSGSMDQMVTLTREAAQIIRDLDPKALVVSPSAAAAKGVPWLSEFLKKGGGQYVDVIAFHFYVDPHSLPPEELLPLIQQVRAILAQNGMADKPLWNTETGWLPPSKFDSDELAAGFLARSLILGWAAGIQRFYWYGWDNQYASIVTYRESTRSVTAAGSAYGFTEKWLAGAKMGSCRSTPDHTWTCQLERSHKKQWIVWNTQADSTFEVPRGWKVTHATGLLQEERPVQGASVRIGPVPVLLTAD